LYRAPDSFPKLTSEDLFLNDHPLGLEIGCGTGEYICELAARQPEVNFVAVEIVLKPLYRAVRQAAEANIANILFIKADFKRLYPLFSPASLQVVYLHFPLPGKKKKHTIFEPLFLDKMHPALLPRGRISVRTDQRPLFEEMFEIAKGDSRYRFVPMEAWGIFGETDLGSPTQKVWEDRGISTQEFELEKI
jgi:tRNA (guanine-N7-)-methyltransferase